ncbi:MAG: RseA family anti-sigma factor [Pseudomonadota bacterium]
MNTTIAEQISAFVDGELSDSESELLLRRMAQDENLRDQAKALLCMRQTIRGESSAACEQFALRVSAAIQAEDTFESNVSAAALSGWPRWLAGGAIAASVAWLALVWAPVPNPGAPGGLATSAQSTTNVDADRITDEVPAYTVPATATDAGLVSADPELAAYFLHHSNSRLALSPASGRYRIVVGDETDAEDAMDVAAGAPR